MAQKRVLLDFVYTVSKLKTIILFASREIKCYLCNE